MSTEASLFPIHFFDSEIFCKKCAQIRKFKIFSQEKYDKTYGKSEIPPNSPLFCRCEECSDAAIYATNEFAQLQEEPTLGLCKIWGMSNLEAGDMVFHPVEKLCAVDGVNRISGSLPQITLINQNKEKIEIQLDVQTFGEQNADAFYRLFPQNSKDARIGDQIYHIKTGLTGKVVGLEFNGGQTVIIKFENGDVEKYYCEYPIYYLTDDVLELNAKWRCRDLPYSQNLQIYSRSKVLHVNCLAPNFNVVCELNKIISSIPQIRCFIMRIILEKSNISPIEIYKELIRNGIYICCCDVELKNQDVYITGFYSVKDTPKNIYRVLQKFPVKKVDLNIRMHSDIKTIKTINESDCFIKISKMGKNVHIDGWVKSEKEKRKAKLKAFFCSFSLRIENHLWVIS